MVVLGTFMEKNIINLNKRRFPAELWTKEDFCWQHRSIGLCTSLGEDQVSIFYIFFFFFWLFGKKISDVDIFNVLSCLAHNDLSRLVKNKIYNLNNTI